VRRLPDDPLLRSTASLRDADPRARLLANLAAARSRLHPFGDVLGVRDPEAGSDAQVLIADSPLLADAEQDCSILALNVGIDVAAGRAARAQLADIGRIATTALTTVAHRAPVGERLWFTARVEHIGEPDERGYRQLVCGGRVRDEAGQVAGGTMVALAMDAARPGGERPAARPAPQDRTVLADLDRVLADAEGRCLTRSLLLGDARLDPAPHGEATIALRPLLENLVHHLQGGAAPSIADLLARDLIGRPELRPQTSHWTFRGPVRGHARFELDVATGSASAHAAIRVSEDGRLRGLGAIDYRPAGAR
jgi:hypothetical protein